MATTDQTVYQAFVDLQNQVVIYQLISFLLGMALVVITIVFMPFIPWAIAKIFTRKPIVALMDKTRNLRFRGGFILRNGMFYYKKQPMYFVKKYSGIFYFAGVPFDICHIDLGFVQHPIYNKFVKELRTMGYRTWKDIDNALEFNTIDKEDIKTLNELGFTSYEEAKEKLNPHGLTRQSKILAPYFSSCPLDELIGYGADVPPASIAGEVDDVVQSQKPPTPSGMLTQYAPLGILILLILVGGAVAYAIVSNVT